MPQQYEDEQENGALGTEPNGNGAGRGGNGNGGNGNGNGGAEADGDDGGRRKIPEYIITAVREAVEAYVNANSEAPTPTDLARYLNALGVSMRGSRVWESIDVNYVFNWGGPPMAALIDAGMMAYTLDETPPNWVRFRNFRMSNGQPIPTHENRSQAVGQALVIATPKTGIVAYDKAAEAEQTVHRELARVSKNRHQVLIAQASAHSDFQRQSFIASMREIDRADREAEAQRLRADAEHSTVEAQRELIDILKRQAGVNNIGPSSRRGGGGGNNKGDAS